MRVFSDIGFISNNGVYKNILKCLNELTTVERTSLIASLVNLVFVRDETLICYSLSD